MLVGAASTVTILMGHSHKYQSLSEVATQPEHVLCLPESKTEESIDFVCQPNELGHATTNLKHGAKTIGLRKAYAVLRGPQVPQAGGHAWLTFVVPPDKFEQYKLQEIKGPLDGTKCRIRQRVLKMPLTSRAILAIAKPAMLFC